ncbi:MAG TPA: hypothetical protein VHS78_06070 [Candidatus Elarobacter sp.]|jgi:hypothetical protein|nr:hypothetical protein [Candidatus Elarobacter sp.]
MNDDRSTADDADTDDEATREDAFDQHDDAVLAADATGMLAGERLITNAEIDEALNPGD